MWFYSTGCILSIISFTHITSCIEAVELCARGREYTFWIVNLLLGCWLCTQFIWNETSKSDNLPNNLYVCNYSSNIYSRFLMKYFCFVFHIWPRSRLIAGHSESYFDYDLTQLYIKFFFSLSPSLSILTFCSTTTPFQKSALLLNHFPRLDYFICSYLFLPLMIFVINFIVLIPLLLSIMLEQ